MEPIRITVRVDPQRTSPNQRLHWRELARRNALARGVARLAWKEAGAPVADGPVRVSVVVRRAHTVDRFNIWSALKAALDGIFVNGLTPDDSPQWVHAGTVDLEIGRQWKGREEVVFVVELMEGP